ncbi:MAG: class A beta-lactamase-related serine hydrolase [Sphingobacteriales bacterium]|nr:MAG: class A beta-lactamase-related serine hydrolase [Sphingobacteriales bacterium]
MNYLNATLIFSTNFAADSHSCMISLFKVFNPLNVLWLAILTFLLRVGYLIEAPDKLQFIFVEPFARLLVPVSYEYAFSPGVNVFLAGLIVIGQALLLNYLVNFYNLLGRSTFLPALMYVTLTSLFAPFMTMSAPLICNFLLIWMLFKLFSFYKSDDAKSTAYDLGMIVAIGSIIYFPYIYLFLSIWIALVIFKPINWRELLSGVLGYATIFFFFAVFYYLNNKLGSFYHIWAPLASKFPNSININYSKAAKIRKILNDNIALGLPGVSVAVLNDSGLWVGAAGFSKIENNTPMMPCNLQYSQSVAKTYMAVAILQLKEQGKINLDEKITKYLPQEITKKVTGAEKMTVRMLLNHTSGVAEYNDKPAYVTYLLEHPLHKFKPTDYLDFVDGAPLQFEPGEKYLYTNTNYELLAMICHEITGDQAKFVRENIFKKLNLQNSYYYDDENYLGKTALVNSYWDRYSNGILENCSKMQKINVASMIGDDGIIATPADYTKFLKGLFENKLLQPQTREEMLYFEKYDKEKEYGYGLGISSELHKGFRKYGHSGGGIGSGCYLGYFPHNKTYFFIAINLGTSVYSPLFKDTEKMIDDLFDAFAE